MQQRVLSPNFIALLNKIEISLNEMEKLKMQTTSRIIPLLQQIIKVTSKGTRTKIKLHIQYKQTCKYCYSFSLFKQ